VIEPASTYWHNGQDLAVDFGLHVPSESNTYRLCLRKDVLDYQPVRDGLVDFIDNKLELAGIIQYLRLPLVNNSPASLLMQTVYEGWDVGNQATIVVDEDFRFIEELSLSNAQPAAGIVSWVFNGPYGVYELSDGNKTRRVGRFLDEPKPALVRHYQSSMSADAGLIVFEDDRLVQERSLDAEQTVAASMVCERCAGQRELDLLAKDYRANAGVVGGWCGT
jgi:hypothetical protein